MPAFRKEMAPAWESLYSGIKSDSSQQNNSQYNENLLEISVESEELSSGKLFDDSVWQNTSRVFQLQNKYLVLPIQNGLMFIHQQAAHERILYEQILKNITVREASSQQLLFPLELDFTPTEVQTLEQIKEQLENTGFRFQSFENDKVTISGVPTYIETQEVEGILQKLATDIHVEIPESAFSQNDILAKSLASATAVRAGISLSSEQQEYVANHLFACTEPTISPNNKRTFVVLSLDEIDQKF